MTVKLYVEGGGDNSALKSECRKGFRLLLENAGFTGRMPRIIACGSRNAAYDHFCTALRVAKKGELPILLVDSETAVLQPNKWQHVLERVGDGWQKPEEATEDHIYFMVQCMETWFLADKEKLKTYFGREFLEKRLPAITSIEEISKDSVIRAISEASHKCHSKLPYSKSRHSFEILALLDPRRIRTASPHAEQFFSKIASP